MTTATTPSTKDVRRWLLGGSVAFLLGVGTLVANFTVSDHVNSLRQAQCNHMFQPITAQMPWYALPLAMTAAVLLLAAVILGVVAHGRAYRAGSGGLVALCFLLVAVAVLATLLALWAGVYGTIADTPIIPTHCVG